MQTARQRTSWACKGLLCHAALGLACMWPVSPLMAQRVFAPSGFFVQTGSTGSTHQIAAGLVWDWDKRWSFAGGEVTGYWELSLSGWSYPSMNGRKQAWLGQVGAIPTFRYGPLFGRTDWFAELGVGATATTRLYQTQQKRFSTSFNFADHIAVGHRFGTSMERELVLRLRHFSNAGIKQPNPGENFAELRYAQRF
jgi:lipid A 3-O-deacylase